MSDISSPYMEAVSASRAMLLSLEDALEGTTTISLETCGDLQEEGIYTYIQEHFSDFLKTLRFLKKEDQELLLSYYMLSKMLDVDTLIPTPDGWKRNGDIVDGDWILDDQGKPTRVVKAHPHSYPDVTYEVELDTGEKIYAGDEHLWVTSTFQERQNATHRKKYRLDTKVRTTQEIYDTQRYQASRRTGKTLANHHIAVAAPLKLPDVDLPIDPYCLGIWLRDGNSDCGIFTGSPNDAKEILIHFTNAGFEWHPNKKDSNRWHVLNLYPALKKLGVIKNKHIPSMYLRASAAQRLALLQGLMDSDGWCTKRGGYCGFSNCCPAIIAGVDELLWSLGIKHRFRPYRASCIYKGERRYSDSWKTSFTTVLPCFRLPRKLSKQKRSGLTGDTLNHHIVRITKVAPRLMRCLTVDSPSHLYLCGKSMVPTHNTQNTLAVIHKSTQTVCSFRIRMAIKTLACFIMIGIPTPDKMKVILEKAGLENGLGSVDLSEVIDLYAKTRSFQKISDTYKLHRPDIRRMMSKASKQLMESTGAKEHALGAYIHSLVDKSSPTGIGYSKRKSAKLGHLYKSDSPILGEFRVNVEHPDFDQFFVSKANRQAKIKRGTKGADNS
jgi:LAGLIDADG-like domain